MPPSTTLTTVFVAVTLAGLVVQLITACRAAKQIYRFVEAERWRRACGAYPGPWATGERPFKAVSFRILPRA